MIFIADACADSTRAVSATTCRHQLKASDRRRFLNRRHALPTSDSRAFEIDHLREFLKPGFEVKFKTASCYEAPQRVLYSRDVAARQRREDRASREETLRWKKEEERTADRMDDALQRDAVGAVGEHRSVVADGRQARSAFVAAAM